MITTFKKSLLVTTFSIVLLSSGYALEAPVTWPEHWSVEEDTDDDGDTSWLASPEEKAEEKNVKFIMISKLKVSSEELDNFDKTPKTLQDNFAQGIASESEEKAPCNQLTAFKYADMPAYEFTCTAKDEDDGDLRYITAFVKGKEHLYTISIVATSKDTETENVNKFWEKIKASAKPE